YDKVMRLSALLLILNFPFAAQINAFVLRWLTFAAIVAFNVMGLMAPPIDAGNVAMIAWRFAQLAELILFIYVLRKYVAMKADPDADTRKITNLLKINAISMVLVIFSLLTW
ncbi:MAG: hypothetical protein KIG14_01530, partial [Candidatus Sacchiramonaceae bacterium]|nr:hypothetical protein [Candidatus Saccharimonadaceae bacterium]